MAEADTEGRMFEPHAERAAVLGEVHARPFRSATAPRLFLHYAFVGTQGQANSDAGYFADLCRSQGVAPPAADARHHVISFGPGVLKWERHAEFITYTWDGPLSGAEAPFAEMPPNHPFGLNFIAPGKLLVAARAELHRDAGALARATAMFDSASLCVSEVLSGRGLALTDFRQDGDSRSRILVVDRGLSPSEAGALVQRLLEIETYRTFALLGLPEAERAAPDLRRIEQELAQIAERIRSSDGLDANRSLLADLSRLAADVEAASARSSYRFGASVAYDEIVKGRLTAIDERAVPGYSLWSGFLDRRMAPAMRTIGAIAARQRDLSDKLMRAAELLRTRVDIDVEQQNRDLLQSMNRRARQQLQLQQTVEGLSVAAISYYVIGLVSHLMKVVYEFLHWHGEPEVATGLSVPVVVVVIYLVVRRIRHAHAG
jgi:uncharacterized membrane-anchored protein